jgi:hypothetical protein
MTSDVQDDEIIRASEFGDIETVLFLLKRSVSEKGKNQRHYDETLCRACNAGYTNIARALLDSGADVNASAYSVADESWSEACQTNNSNAGFPLSVAAERSEAELVRLLLERGAESLTAVIYSDAFSWSYPASPLQLACTDRFGTNTETVRILLAERDRALLRGLSDPALLAVNRKLNGGCWHYATILLSNFATLSPCTTFRMQI